MWIQHYKVVYVILSSTALLGNRIASNTQNIPECKPEKNSRRSTYIHTSLAMQDFDSDFNEAREYDYIEDGISETSNGDDDFEDLFGDGFEECVVPVMHHIQSFPLVTTFRTTNLIAMMSVSWTIPHIAIIL